MLTNTCYGKGKNVVFLHGFCESKEIWSELAEGLKDNYRIIALDLPGFGDNGYNEHDTSSIENMAKAVHDSLVLLKVDTCVLIGHSLGGYVALALAKLYPKLVQGLGLFHSTAFADSEEKKEARNKTARYLLEYGVKSFIEPFVPALFYSRRRKELASSIEQVIQIGLKTPQETIVAVTYAMRDRESQIELLKQLEVPVLFIIGKEDTAVTLDKSLEQCHLPKQSLCLFLEETGHQGMFERPQESLAAIKGFLQLCLNTNLQL